MTNDEIDRIVAQRDEARGRRDYVTSDKLRDFLLSVRAGNWRIKLLDEPDGTFWYWSPHD